MYLHVFPVAVSFIALASTAVAAGAQRPLICYWESWSRYRVAPYTGSVENIPIHLCTHLIYAFAGLDENTWKVKSLEPYWDLDLGGFNQLVALKQKNPKLKVSFAVGGWNEGATKYSDLVSDPNRIKIFVDSVMQWITTFGFDGLDLDWEYPADAARGGKSQDKANLIVLLRALRQALGEKLLTIATCIPVEKIAAGYDVPQMVKYVDFIHVMAYDLRGSWDNVIGNHVSLYPSANDRGLYSKLTVEQGMQNWLDAGAPREKLIMGLAFYGRSFKLADPSNKLQGALSGGSGTSGPVSQQDGTLFYFEICKKLREGWTRVFDDDTKTPRAFSGDQWVGYDDTEGIRHKIELLDRKKYAGVMIWAIDLDDASNSCGKGNYPLATATFEALRGENSEENEIDVGTRSSSGPTGWSTVSESDQKRTTESDQRRTTETNTRREVVTESGPIVDCSSGEGFLPHPTHCSMFIRCVSRKPVEMTCPTGLIFDASVSVCNWPVDVDPKLPKGCPDANP
ncbi:acidic mammalian chitinase [Galendromus occidentalis]|uniref:Acidic mammalian chitinase n=1 Tax=Galendromus occidentalis TaxID=34638 RepID=A0AAJ6QXW7_9ACAR|nr:acidic mammalian chitinase [Galendromus occidentalis]